LFAGHMAGCVAPPEVMLTIARLAAGHMAGCVASLEFILTAPPLKVDLLKLEDNGEYY
jgi:hypothetical protein